MFTASPLEDLLCVILAETPHDKEVTRVLRTGWLEVPAALKALLAFHGPEQISWPSLTAEEEGESRANTCLEGGARSRCWATLGAATTRAWGPVGLREECTWKTSAGRQVAHVATLNMPNEPKESPYRIAHTNPLKNTYKDVPWSIVFNRKIFKVNDHIFHKMVSHIAAAMNIIWIWENQLLYQ